VMVAEMCRNKQTNSRQKWLQAGNEWQAWIHSFLGWNKSGPGLDPEKTNEALVIANESSPSCSKIYACSWLLSQW
jgi:hypothetical protein